MSIIIKDKETGLKIDLMKLTSHEVRPPGIQLNQLKDDEVKSLTFSYGFIVKLKTLDFIECPFDEREFKELLYAMDFLGEHGKPLYKKLETMYHESLKVRF